MLISWIVSLSYCHVIDADTIYGLDKVCASKRIKELEIRSTVRAGISTRSSCMILGPVCGGEECFNPIQTGGLLSHPVPSPKS